MLVAKEADSSSLKARLLRSRAEAAWQRRDVELVGRLVANRLLANDWGLDNPIAAFVGAVLHGEDPGMEPAVDPDLWFDLLVATADAVGDDPVIFVLGDTGADELLDADPAARGWLLGARRSHPGVDAMIRAMGDFHRSSGIRSWWADN